MPEQECTCEPEDDDVEVRNNAEINKKHVTFGDYRKETMGESGKDHPPYLPQQGDDIPTSASAENSCMGPIGPWATGRVDWGALAGLTGTRPVVDHYSITRFSPAEWRKHNKDVLCGAAENQYRSNLIELSSRQAMETMAAASDKGRLNNTNRLIDRGHTIHRWKTQVEQAIQDMITELESLELQRRRTKLAKSVHGKVKAINAECLSRRALRMEPDLVRDSVEEELIKEAALIKEINDLVDRTLNQIEEQIERNKAIKARLEDDWSDKKESYEIEILNVKLNISSPLIMFKPGATRVPDSQSTPGGWEDNCRDILQTAEATRNQSCHLRDLLDGPILSDCVRDLRAQADRVDKALAERIAETDLCRQALENELQVVNRRMAETENLITQLKFFMRGLDYTMKTAQTRLDNRHRRPRIENSRDEAQYGLIDEVKSTSENAATVKQQIEQAEKSLIGLQTARGDLEREIQIKLKSLYIDKERCQEVRSHYPSVTAMSGH